MTTVIENIKYDVSVQGGSDVIVEDKKYVVDISAPATQVIVSDAKNVVNVDDVDHHVTVENKKYNIEISNQVGPRGMDGAGAESFATVSKNLPAHDYEVVYEDGLISAIIYNTGSGEIRKSINYTNGIVESVVLSGDIPPDINTTQSIQYDGEDLSRVTYQ